MQRLVTGTGHGAARRPPWGLFAALFGSLLLAACADVPDYANPVAWYDSVVDAFDGEEEPTGDELPRAEAIPGAHDPFPSLGEVPEAPSRDAALVELETVEQGLVADRETAAYTDQQVRVSDDTVVIVEPDPSEPPEMPAPSSGGNVTVVAPPEPAPRQVVQAAPQPVVQQPVQPAVQTPAMSAYAAAGPVDVKNLFQSMFNASGASGVAPAAGGMQATGYSSVPAYTPGVTANAFAGTGVGLPGAGTKVGVVYFATGSSRLSADARAAIDKVAAVYKLRGGAFRVVGHASRRTREMALDQRGQVNHQVSLERARSVANELMRHGVPAERIAIEALGDSQPQYHEWMPSGEAGNRRAEIFYQL